MGFWGLGFRAFIPNSGLCLLSKAQPRRTSKLALGYIEVGQSKYWSSTDSSMLSSIIIMSISIAIHKPSKGPREAKPDVVVHAQLSCNLGRGAPKRGRYISFT